MSALINIEIQRLTNKIPFDLPAVVFGLNDFWAKYYDNVNWQLPTGAAKVVVKDAIFVRNEVQIIYQSIYGSDTIVITCNEIAYPSLLNATGFNQFEIQNINYTISDMSLASKQFIQRVNVSEISLFGRTVIDSYTPNQFRNDMVKLNDFIDLPVRQTINADRCFNTKMVYSGVALSSQTMNLSLTIKK